jgi:Fe2+ transport system protein B
VTITAMYVLGTAAAFGMAALFHRTMLKGESPTFLLEMPPYRLPSLRTVVYQMFERAWLFLKRAGTVILSISIVLWFLATYPKAPAGTPKSEQVRNSYAGQGRPLHRAGDPAARLRLEDGHRASSRRSRPARCSSPRWGRSTT